MTIGTRSLLFGAHQFILHPIMLAIAWTRLYGFPRDLRYWIAFIVHDWGYYGKPNMDGKEGETHPELGGRIMERLFGEPWGRFTKYHSRFYAKSNDEPISKLCVADKYATVITPAILYLPMISLTGEVTEFVASVPKYGPAFEDRVQAAGRGMFGWHQAACSFMAEWVEKHKHDAFDWTDYAIRIALQQSDAAIQSAHKEFS